MTSLTDPKKALRTQLRAWLNSLDEGEIAARSLQAARRLTATKAFKAAQTVMIFLPLPREIDTRPIALRAWQAGKTVAVPLVSYTQKHMLSVELRSLDEPMEIDRYGVRTPSQGLPIPVETIDLVVVPGLGFDRQGHRLGRGGGFYDRFLSQRGFGGVICGLGFHEQLTEAIPVQQHDVRLEMLVTDQEVIRFSQDQ